MSKRKSGSSPRMSGVYAALATPRLPNSLEGSAAALLEYIDTVTGAGVDGLVLFGSTGEFIHFDLAERMRILSLAIRRTRIPLVVNVSHSSFGAVLELAENAIDGGAAGILLMPPYFYRYADEQLFTFYDRFCGSIGSAIPVYIYNIPFFTNPISPVLVERLLLTGKFAGIKDSSGEWPLFETVQAACKKVRCQSMIGNERLYARARRAGADGIVSGVAAALPELIVALDRAIRDTNAARILVLENRLQEFLDCADRFPATIAIKQAATMRGWKLDHTAIPLDEETQRALHAYRHWLEGWLPLVLSECAGAEST